MLPPSEAEQKETIEIVRTGITTMMENSSESRRMAKQGRGRVDATKSSNLCKWTSKFVTIVFLLTFVSSAHSLPVDGNHNLIDMDRVAHHRDSQLTQQPSQYQLVHQGQLYLPSLIQKDPESLASTSDSDYPVNSQNEDDSIGKEWETVIDPHVYILNEWASSRPTSAIQQRKRRSAAPSLSIVNPLDVLRQRLLLEIARRRMIKSQNQIIANAEILKHIGRRR